MKTDKNSLTMCMCCPKDVFLNLCEIYPNTHQSLIELAIMKRDIYMHYLDKVKESKKPMDASGVPHGIDS